MSVVAGGALLAALWCGCGARLPQELDLEEAMPVEGPGRFQPSGLALRDGALWTVSDKHGLVVFRLELADGVAKAVGAAPASPGDASVGILDYDAEGLAFRGNSIYLASEETSRIYRATVGGNVWEPVTPDLALETAGEGAFAVENAGIEGIAILDDGTLVVAVERQPRGIIEVTESGGEPRVRFQMMESTRYPKKKGTSLDFADLTTWRGRLFALARNQCLVVELVRDGQGNWREGDAWSYRETENDARIRYRNRAFGLGEGLAIDDAHIHVVLDNNDDGREADPKDNRPQLFIFNNSIPR